MEETWRQSHKGEVELTRARHVPVVTDSWVKTRADGCQGRPPWPTDTGARDLKRWREGRTPLQARSAMTMSEIRHRPVC